MNNFISMVDKFNLVIYTDENSAQYIDTKENPKIKVIIKPMEQFYNYRYKDAWIKNHKNPTLLNENTEWKLNMLWSEKVWFVHETMNNTYFDTEYYGWCDIGYFRNRKNDLSTKYLSNWPNNSKILNMDKNKIHYACINNSVGFMLSLEQLIKNKNAVGLPKIPIPPKQQSVAGGFFMLHKSKINWWKSVYDAKLELYLKNNYVVKDDQIIIIDCIFSNKEHFMLYRENPKILDNQILDNQILDNQILDNQILDNWFMFQRLLL
jgi:hypothetical protein